MKIWKYIDKYGNIWKSIQKYIKHKKHIKFLALFFVYGYVLRTSLVPLASFCLHFGSVWFNFGCVWLSFSVLWDPCWSIWCNFYPFGSILTLWHRPCAQRPPQNNFNSVPGILASGVLDLWCPCFDYFRFWIVF